MGDFSSKTKPWLRSVIRQRKMLIRLNKSHKDQMKEEIALARLEAQLNAYPYDNDLHLARFIRNFHQDIEIILPGNGSTCYDKKQVEFKDINKRAILVISANIKFKFYETQQSC
jgi:hypothetical protein